MNHQRFSAFTRGADVGTKALALPLKIALQAVLVESGFANRLHFGMLRALQQRRHRRLFNVFVIGMNAGGGVNVCVTLGQGYDRWPFRVRHADAHRMRDIRCRHAGNDRIGILSEIRKIDMTVGIYKHRRNPLAWEPKLHRVSGPR